jgi:serine/threonine protein kinase
MEFSDEPTQVTPPEGGGGGSLTAGQVFGQYKILRLLGRGGMGEVYAVRHVVLGTRYALKVLLREFAHEDEARERFRKEARAMAVLSHPNIVRVDDFFEIGGLFCLRMELVEDLEKNSSITLADYLQAQDRQLSEDIVRILLFCILSGLSAAHVKGLAHLDMKPSNILLAEEEEGYVAKISDFGLVRVIGEDWLKTRVQDAVRRSMTLGGGTRITGSLNDRGNQALMGTYAYMSPEQKRGENGDVRSDVYSVGLMAFQMLTGEETMGLDLPSQLVEGINIDWDEWIRKATRPKREDRFSDANEMLQAIPSNLSKRHGSTASNELHANSPDHSPPDTKRDQNFIFTKDPTGLTKILKFMLWAQLTLSIIGLIGDFMQLNLASSASLTSEQAEANDTRQGLIASFYFWVSLITGIFFLKWIYRANLNCRGFGAEGMSFSSGWSIGFYFIPILNLFKPYQAMKEIWKVSSDPLNWKSEKISDILLWWWGLWVFSHVIKGAADQLLMNIYNMSTLALATGVSIISWVVEIALISVALSLVSQIIEKQINLVNPKSS